MCALFLLAFRSLGLLLRFLPGPWKKCEDIERAVLFPYSSDLGRPDRHLGQLNAITIRLQGCYSYIERFETDDRLVRDVVHGKRPDGNIASNGKGRHLVLGLRECNAHLEVDLSRWELEVQLCRYILEICRYIDILRLEIEVRFEGFGKRLGLPFYRVWISVDGCGKLRLHKYVRVGCPVRYKWDRDVHVADSMLYTFRAVDEVDAPVKDRNIVHREGNELRLILFIIFCRLPLDHVRKVVCLILVPDDPYIWFR